MFVRFLFVYDVLFILFRITWQSSAAKELSSLAFCSCCSYLMPSKLVGKDNASLKILLQQGIWEPKSYGDLVYRIRKMGGKSHFSEQFRKLINRYKRIWYNPYIMRQTACLFVNPNTVNSNALLFNCTAVVRASDSMTASSQSFQKWVGAWCYVFGLARRNSTSCFLKLWLAVGLVLAVSTLLCFIIVINLIFVLSLWCMDWVRKPLYEPKFFMYFYYELHRDPGWRLSTVKNMFTPAAPPPPRGSLCYWPF